MSSFSLLLHLLSNGPLINVLLAPEQPCILENSASECSFSTYLFPLFLHPVTVVLEGFQSALHLPEYICYNCNHSLAKKQESVAQGLTMNVVSWIYSNIVFYLLNYVESSKKRMINKQEERWYLFFFLRVQWVL